MNIVLKTLSLQKFAKYKAVGITHSTNTSLGAIKS